MTQTSSQIDALDQEIDTLGSSIAVTASMVSALNSELGTTASSFERTRDHSAKFSKTLERSFKSAFTDLIFEGDKASDVLRNIGQSIMRMSVNALIDPIASGASNLVSSGIEALLGGVLPFAKGGVFTQGRVTPFAKGGVVSQATHFPMANGTGLMGEAGPEAIMPLARGPNGALGVRAAGGSAPNVNVTMHIQTPDAASFHRSQNQLAGAMRRAMSRAGRYA